MPYADPEKQRKFNREWLQKRRRAWIKKHGPCKCGSRKSLEVDHIDRTTKVSHRVWSWRQERRDAELAKCEVKCKKCHTAKSGREVGLLLRKPLIHGTRNAYDTYQCRCEVCKSAYAKYRASLPYRNKSFIPR